MTNLILHNIIEPELKVYNYNAKLSSLITDELDNKLENLINDSYLISIKIWNTKLDLIYSSNKNFIEHYNNKNNLKQALQSKENYVISNIDKNSPYLNLIESNKIIKFYLPVTSNNKTIGVYEVIKSYDDIGVHIKKLTFTISIIILLGLFLLYILLFRIVYNSSMSLAKQNERLTESKRAIEVAFKKLNANYKDTLLTLSSAIDARDPYTAGHSRRVANISLKIGKRLGLNKDILDTLEVAALLHDIGKIGIPDKILHKPSKLNDYEYSKIKEHPAIGVNILKNVKFLEDAVPIILYHHERLDGGGYPLGIKGDKIPLEARIIAVADSYDAMVSDRPYRKGLHEDIAIGELIRFKNMQFDSVIVDAFLKTLEQTKEELA
jgi:putative nucleotidyltransferase with HDIG domain